MYVLQKPAKRLYPTITRWVNDNSVLYGIKCIVCSSYYEINSKTSTVWLQWFSEQLCITKSNFEPWSVFWYIPRPQRTDSIL